MGYTARTSAGLALLAAGLTVVEYALFNLIHAGACLSNNDFTAVGGCFDGMPRWYRLIPVGLAFGILGLLLFRIRGTPPADPDPDPDPGRESETGAATGKLGTGVVAWSAAFVATSAMLAFAGAGPNPVDGTSARRGAIAAAIVLLAVGLVPLLQAVRGLASPRATADPAGWSPPPGPAWTPSARPQAASPPVPPSAPRSAAPAARAPAIERLTALARERDSGAISGEEFERAKAEILAEMSRGL
jgi:hypothetical protein